ncbi:hypothetical protein [Clostridium tetanomorphum]|uniref:hypothetical protein n=1 Tax=Clostridium tetanomorphum TaxID=1553 RepID=UPI0031199F74
MKSNIEKFKKDYNKDTNNERIVEIIDEYEGNYNIKIVILNNANELKLITKPTKIS